MSQDTISAPPITRSAAPRSVLRIDENRDADFAARLLKHTLVGAASTAFSRLAWLTPIFNYKTELQTDDLVFDESIQSRRRKEMAREDWWNYAWRGLSSEFALQSGLFLLSRAVWHNKRFGLLNYLGDNGRDHNLLTTVMQNALTTTVLYPLYKYRVQKALLLENINEADKRSSAPSLINTDYSHVQTEPFKSYLLYNVLLGVSSFVIEKFVREQWLGITGGSSTTGLKTAADAREDNTWSYYLSQTIAKILLNPLEVILKKKIVEDTAPGTVRLRERQASNVGSVLGDYFKGSILTIPEVLMTGIVEFYLYRWGNRSFSPHSSTE